MLQKDFLKATLTLCIVCMMSVIHNPLLALDLSGSIRSDSTLTLAESPYNITGNLNVRDGATLTIESGVTINFPNRSYHINIGYNSSSTGVINATNVTFEGDNSDSYSNYVRIKAGSSGTITNCTFNNVELSITGASPAITNNTFNDGKFALTLADTSHPTLTGNTYNDITNMGIALSGNIYSDFTLENYNMPYFLTNSLYVRNGARLTIAKGSTIYYHTTGDISVGTNSTSTGKLIADSVYFYGYSSVNNSSDQLRIQYGKGSSIKNCYFTNLDLHIADSNTIVEASSFDNSPITIEASSPVLNSLKIKNTNYILQFLDDANPSFTSLDTNNITYNGISWNGDIYKDYTLKNYGCPYFITGNIYVRNNANLTIEDGDSLYYQSTYDIRVGYYNTDTAAMFADSVYFHGYSYTNSTSDEVIFKKNSYGTISNCEFHHLNITIEDATPTIESSKLFHSPIALSGSPTLTDIYLEDVEYLFKFIGVAYPVITSLDTHKIKYPAIGIQGTFNADYSLRNYHMPYFVTNHIYVRDGAILTLEDGDSIFFQGNYDLSVGYNSSDVGHLIADSVFIQGYPNNYDEVVVNENSSVNLSNCLFNDIGIQLNNDSVSIESSTFDNSPVSISQGAPVLQDVTIKNTDYIVKLTGPANPDISKIDTVNITYPGIGFGGTFEEDYTMDNQIRDYYITNILNIRKDATLTIEDNVRVHFPSYYGINVGYSKSNKGNIVANKVDFISDYSSGINLNIVSESTLELDSCNLNGVRITANNTSPKITYTTFSNCDKAFVSNNLSTPTINYCNFTQNKIAIENNDTNFLDARYNYWGHMSGPRHESNATGFGELISGNIEFVPFLTYPDGDSIKAILIESVNNFDSVYIGYYSEHSLTITNKGNFNLMIPDIKSASGAFFSTLDLPVWIAPNDTITIPIRFTPNNSGLLKDTLHILTNDTSNSDIEIPVFGVGCEVVILSNTNVSFGEVYLKKSTTKQIYIKNVYSSNVRLDSITTTSRYFRINKSKLPGMYPAKFDENVKSLKAAFLKGTNIYASDSLWIDIIFRPVERKTYTDTLRIYYSNYGVKQVIVNGIGKADSLSVTITSIDYKNFPYIYINVKVDTLGVSLNTLTTKDFYCQENGVRQLNKFHVTPPGQSGGTRLADIVFVMDNSGSMGDEQDAVRDNVISFVNDLDSSGINFGLGLCRYGATTQGGNPIVEDAGLLTSDAEYFKSNVWARNDVSGSNEPGYKAIVESINSFSFRPGAQKILIIITDETPKQGSLSMDDALVACEYNSVTLFALTLDELFDMFYPITDETNGDVFDITSPFNVILDYISEAVSETYIVQYESNIETWGNDGILAEIFTSYHTWIDSDTVRYFPGGAPTIERTPQTVALHGQNWAEGSDFIIEASVVDHVEPFVQSVRLYYRTTGDSVFYPALMTSASSNIYKGSVPTDSVRGPGFEYYLQASDGNNTVTLPSVDPLFNPYQIAILPNKSPLIVHTPAPYYMPNTDLTITATITDNTNRLDTAMLYYRRLGQLLYQSKPLTKISGNAFEATITSSFMDSSTVEYYLKAIDDFGVASLTGWPDSPIKVSMFVEDPNQLDLLTKNKISIFPNPVNQGKTIQLTLARDEDLNNIKLKLYSQSGKEITNLINNNTTKSGLDLFYQLPEDLPKGIYILKIISTKSEQHMVEKLIIL